MRELRTSNPKLSCYLDQAHSLPGQTPPPSIFRYLRRAGVLVIVVTEEAIESKWVSQEIEEFVPQQRAIVPIAVGQVAEKVRCGDSPLRELQGVKYETEDTALLESGRPSAHVIDRVLGAISFRIQDDRIRRAIGSTIVASVALLLMASAVSIVLVSDARATRERALEDAQTAAAGARAYSRVALSRRLAANSLVDIREAKASSLHRNVLRNLLSMKYHPNTQAYSNLLQARRLLPVRTYRQTFEQEYVTARYGPADPIQFIVGDGSVRIRRLGVAAVTEVVKSKDPELRMLAAWLGDTLAVAGARQLLVIPTKESRFLARSHEIPLQDQPTLLEAEMPGSRSVGAIPLLAVVTRHDTRVEVERRPIPEGVEYQDEDEGEIEDEDEEDEEPSYRISSSYRIEVWTISKGEPLRIGSIDHPGEVTALVLDPDRGRLGTANNLGDVFVWAAKGKDQSRPLVGPMKTDGVTFQLQFSADGRLIAHLGADADPTIVHVFVFDSSTGKAVDVPYGDRYEEVTAAIAFSPNGKYLAAATLAGEWGEAREAEAVLVWSLDRRNGFKTAAAISLDDRPAWEGLVFSPHGKYLAIRYFNDTVRIFDATSWKEIARISAPGAQGMSFDDAETHISVVGSSSIQEWALPPASDVLQRDLPAAPADSLPLLQFTPDERGIFVAHGGELRRFDLRSDRPVLTLRYDGKIENLVLGSNNRIAVMTRIPDRSQATRVYQVNSARGTAVHLRDIARGKYLESVAFTQQDKLLVSGNRIVDIDTGVTLEEIEDEFVATTSSERFWFSADGKFRASVAPNSIQLLDLTTGNDLAPMPRGHHVQFSPDSKRILVVDTNGGAWVRPVMSNGPGVRLPHEGRDAFMRGAFSANGRYVIGKSNYNRYLFWDTQHDNELKILRPDIGIPSPRNPSTVPGFMGAITGAVAIEDERLFITAGRERVQIWDVSGREVVEIGRLRIGDVQSPDRELIGMQLSPSGRYLALAERTPPSKNALEVTATIRVIEYLPDQLERILIHRLHRDLTAKEWEEDVPGEPHCRLLNEDSETVTDCAFAPIFQEDLRHVSDELKARGLHQTVAEPGS